MLVMFCDDGIVRVGDGGGITIYDSLIQVAGQPPTVRLHMTTACASRALQSFGRPWRTRLRDRMWTGRGRR